MNLYLDFDLGYERGVFHFDFHVWNQRTPGTGGGMRYAVCGMQVGRKQDDNMIEAESMKQEEG